MSTRLGVDLSSSRAALASVRETRRSLQLRGFAVFDADGSIHEIAGSIEQARRTHHFPRAAEVVAWPGDARIEAVARSGCRVERVITPGEALARVARLHYKARPASGVAAVVALHPTSGDVAIVRDGHLLFERQMSWSVAAKLSGPGSELLRLYTFVSELTESLRRVFETARTTHQAQVTEILTCGSLANLRSLTMPLAAEFDVEVETLDSTDDIDIRVPGASPQQLRDAVAGLRLAIAAGKRWHKRGGGELLRALRPRRLSVVTRAAAVAAVGVLAVLAWVRFVTPTTPGRPPAAASSTRSNEMPPARTNASSRAGGARALPESVPVPPVRSVPATPALVSRPLRVSVRLQPALRGLEHTQRLLTLARAEQATLSEQAARTTEPVSGPRASTVAPIRVSPGSLERSPSRVVTSPPLQAPTRAVTEWSPSAAAVKALPAQPVKSMRSAVPSAQVVAGPTEQRPPRASGQSESFLGAPADVAVTSILWSSDRQLAVVNNRIVGAGDVVGTDTVVEVRVDAVIFRDRSGRLHRAALGGQPQSE